MIRLRGSGAAEADLRQVAVRLRGATLEPCSDVARLVAEPTTFDAALFVGAIPPDQERIERLLNAQKHVLLATTTVLLSDGLEQLVSVSRQRNVQFAVVNPERYSPAHQLIRQQLDAGKLGEVGLLRLHRWEAARANGPSNPLGLPVALVRDLELTIWLLGTTPNLVYAVATEAGGFVQVHLGFPGGGMAVLDECERLPEGDGYVSLSVIGAAGAAYADDHQNVQLLYRGGSPRAVRSNETIKQLTGLTQSFVDALQTGHDLSANNASWQEAWKVVEVVRRSLATRQAIPLEER